MKRNNIILIMFLFTLVYCSKSNDNGGNNNGGDNKEDSLQAQPGDVVGKITVGYQGWFACKGDGSPIDAWWHWGQDWGTTPSTTNKAFISWPDVRDYTNTFTTNF